MVRCGRAGVWTGSGVGVRGRGVVVGLAGVVRSGSVWAGAGDGSTSVMVEALNSAWAEMTSTLSLKMVGDMLGWCGSVGEGKT